MNKSNESGSIDLIESKTDQRVTIKTSDIINDDRGTSYTILDGVTYMSLSPDHMHVFDNSNIKTDVLLDEFGYIAMCTVDGIYDVLSRLDAQAAAIRSECEYVTQALINQAALEDKSRELEICKERNRIRRNIHKNTNELTKHNGSNVTVIYNIFNPKSPYIIDRSKVDKLTMALTTCISANNRRSVYRSSICHLYYDDQVYVPIDYIYRISKIARASIDSLSKTTANNKVKYAHDSICRKIMNKSGFDRHVPKGINGSMVLLQKGHKKLITLMVAVCDSKGIVIDEDLCMMIYKESKSGRPQYQASIGIHGVEATLQPNETPTSEI